MPHSRTAAAAQIESPVVQPVTLNLSRGVQRPQWSIVKRDYAGSIPFLAAGAVFTTTSDVTYVLDLDLRGATFVGCAGEQPHFDVFHATAPINPIQVSPLDATRQRVQVQWTTPKISAPWNRWIYRFFVTRGVSGAPEPFPLAFAFIPDTETLLPMAASPPETAQTSPSDAVIDSTPTLTTRMRLINGQPEFPDAFHYEGIHLPAGVYVEPMITVLEPEQAFRLAFISRDGVLAPAHPKPCNPGRGDQLPLALDFYGVTDAKPRCPGTPSGFTNSTLNASTFACQVDWCEPPSRVGRAASFLFANCQERTGDKALVDPTVINSLEKDPPGGFIG